MSDDPQNPPLPGDEIGLTISGEWLQMIRQMGARLSKSEVEVIMFSLGHLYNMLNHLAPNTPVVLKRDENDNIFVGTFEEESRVEPDPTNVPTAWHISDGDVDDFLSKIESFANHPSTSSVGSPQRDRWVDILNRQDEEGRPIEILYYGDWTPVNDVETGIETEYEWRYRSLGGRDS